MEKDLSYKKQIKSFILIATIIHTLLYTGINILTKDVNSENPTLMSELMNSLPHIAVAVVTLTLFFFMGKKLIDDKRKAIIFMGSVYFGNSVIDTVTVIFSCTAEALSSLGYIHPDIHTAIGAVIDIIEIPFSVIAAYYAFTAFEGINRKFADKNLDSSQMHLSRAKNRYLGYELIGGAVISLVATLPTFILSAFIFDNLYHDNSEAFTVISTQVSLSFTMIAGFLLVYFAGYKPYKSHIDAMAFVACQSLGAEIGNIFVNILLIPTIFTSGNISAESIEDTAQAMSLLSSLGITSIFVLLSSVISLVLPVFVMKYFFSDTRITLFSETSPITSTNTEVKETTIDAE